MSWRHKFSLLGRAALFVLRTAAISVVAATVVGGIIGSGAAAGGIGLLVGLTAVPATRGVWRRFQRMFKYREAKKEIRLERLLLKGDKKGVQNLIKRYPELENKLDVAQARANGWKWQIDNQIAERAASEKAKMSAGRFQQETRQPRTKGYAGSSTNDLTKDFGKVADPAGVAPPASTVSVVNIEAGLSPNAPGVYYQ